MQFPSLISPELNQSSKPLNNTSNTGVCVQNFGPPNNCVIEKIIPETNGHDSEQFNSIWASLDNDVELKSDNNTSSDSYVSNSNVVSKLTLVPINPGFHIPSVWKTSKSSFESWKKPWINKKDIVHPKIEAKKALEKETRSRQCSRFLVKFEKKMPQIVSPTTRSHNTFMFVKILKRPFVPVSSDFHNTYVNGVKNVYCWDLI